MEHWKQHILVVDDDVAILDCIRMSIKKDIPCQITTTSDSLEALELLKNNVYNVEIPISDGGFVQIALKYDSRYELWILSEVNHRQIEYDFIQNFIAYVLIFIIVHAILFLLFKICN